VGAGVQANIVAIQTPCSRAREIVPRSADFENGKEALPLLRPSERRTINVCSTIKNGGEGGGGGGAAPTAELINDLIKKLCRKTRVLHSRGSAKNGEGGRGGGRGEGGRRVGRTAAAPPPRAVRVELRSAAKQ
jgi:hypothetical protein